MLQSRFFISSLQEVQLHVKEIYSLQVGLRQAIAYKTKKTKLFDTGSPITIIETFRDRNNLNQPQPRHQTSSNPISDPPLPSAAKNTKTINNKNLNEFLKKLKTEKLLPLLLVVFIIYNIIALLLFFLIL